jgi:hypothetical protein
VVRIVGAALTLLAVLWFDRRAEKNLAALAIFLAAAFYMTVLNPRVETNTYMMLAVPAAITIAYLWQQERGGVLSIVLSAAIFLCGFSGVERHVLEFLDLWFRPIAMSLIALPLLWWLWDRARRNTVSVESGAYG